MHTILLARAPDHYLLAYNAIGLPLLTEKKAALDTMTATYRLAC